MPVDRGIINFEALPFPASRNDDGNINSNAIRNLPRIRAMVVFRSGQSEKKGCRLIANNNLLQNLLANMATLKRVKYLETRLKEQTVSIVKKFLIGQ